MEGGESLEHMIARLKIDLKHPLLDEKELKNATYLVIRHAYSEYNHKVMEIQAKYGEESKEMRALKEDPSMYDPDLHAIGKMQGESN